MIGKRSRAWNGGCENGVAGGWEVGRVRGLEPRGGPSARSRAVAFGPPRSGLVLLCRRCNMDWRWPPTYGSGPFAPATPCTHVPGRYSGPNKFKRRVAHPWSWDIGSSNERGPDVVEHGP